VAGRVGVGLPPNIEQADLVSYGIFGLIDAIEKFDIDRAIKFAKAIKAGTENGSVAQFPSKIGDLGIKTLWAAVQERDLLGDDLVPDYFTHIQQGDFYGWPYAYSGPHPDPSFGKKRPDLVAKTKTPDVMFAAHSAPLSSVTRGKP